MARDDCRNSFRQRNCYEHLLSNPRPLINLVALKTDVSEEVAAILSSDFAIDVTNTQIVPHSSDGTITFPNLDNKSQGTKLIKFAVLYVDMRRSTQLSLQHRRHTVAKLYSAFVRAMTRCAGQFGGEVRGIIGDRVMILFNSTNCFTAAVDTAILINSVCRYTINKHFVHNEVTFGIGIDYGRMLATKTGIRRHGAAQQSYRSLVWLGRPANIASKLTDNANKDEEFVDLVKLNVAYLRGGQLVYFEEISPFVCKQLHVRPNKESDGPQDQRFIHLYRNTKVHNKARHSAHSDDKAGLRWISASAPERSMLD